MSKRITAAVTAGVAGTRAVRSVGRVRHAGGVPHSTKPCPTHSDSGEHKGVRHGKKKGASKGKKCR
jgi:hypothetical protein